MNYLTNGTVYLCIGAFTHILSNAHTYSECVPKTIQSGLSYAIFISMHDFKYIESLLH